MNGCRPTWRSILLAVVYLAAQPWTEIGAKASERVYKVGSIAYGKAGGPGYTRRSWREELRQLGYVEGRNLVVEERFAEGSAARAVELASELVRLNVDVIVAQATPTAHAVKSVTRTVPIVVAAADPVGTGLVASLARPGGNITGISNNLLEPAAKRLELLREAIPGLDRVAYLASTQDPAAPLFVQQVTDAGRQLGVAIEPVFVEGPAQFDAAFAAIRAARAKAILVQPLFTIDRAAVLALARREGLPVASDFRVFAESGALLAYGLDGAEHQKRIAAFIDRILKGARPADLPMEEPTKYELVVNLRTAKELGITLPQALLLRADEVIE
jgi:putative tryptophan/tyrosine transport system substrate-binding protein